MLLPTTDESKGQVRAPVWICHRVPTIRGIYPLYQIYADVLTVRICGLYQVQVLYILCCVFSTYLFFPPVNIQHTQCPCFILEMHRVLRTSSAA